MTTRLRRRPVDVTPSARRLTASLRDIGYSFVAAIADIVDNSVSADASRVDIEIAFEGASSYILIGDDGRGMTEGELNEALRFGTRREYNIGELGRYGLGLKTASISQCRRVTVVTRRALMNRRLAAKTLDLDHVERTDRWQVIDPVAGSSFDAAVDRLANGPGTVVLWENLDRLLPERRPEGGWARRRLEQLTERARDYLGMVFHRLLEGDAQRARLLTITINGEKIPAWNPFAPLEAQRKELPMQSFETAGGGLQGHVILRRYVLPARDQFSSSDEFERMSGPLKWNRQQGLYIYRADRLVQHGGWCGIRAQDEHTKLARASLDFQTDLDPLFQINVSKMRVSIPSGVRTLLDQPIHELCHRADSVYRREERAPQSEARQAQEVEPKGRNATANGQNHRPSREISEIGTALISSALDAGEHDALGRIMDRLRIIDASLACDLGW